MSGGYDIIRITPAKAIVLTLDYSRDFYSCKGGVQDDLRDDVFSDMSVFFVLFFWRMGR